MVKGQLAAGTGARVAARWGHPGGVPIPLGCPKCETVLGALPQGKVTGHVPLGFVEGHESFFLCPCCQLCEKAVCFCIVMVVKEDEES